MMLREKRQLSLRFSRVLSRVVIQVSGDLDSVGARVLGEAMVEVIDAQGNLNVLVDLHHLGAIDDDGVQVLADAHRRLQRHGGILTISAPSPGLRRVLEQSGIRPALNVTRI
jgi:anti-anti-sigma factor